VPVRVGRGKGYTLPSLQSAVYMLSLTRLNLTHEETLSTGLITTSHRTRVVKNLKPLGTQNPIMAQRVIFSPRVRSFIDSS
jgi:hypothetical protein